MAKKTKTDTAVKLDPLDLERENDELLKQMELLTQQVIMAEDRYAEERNRRREEQSLNADLKDRVLYLCTQLEASRELRNVEKSKRHGSIPKFVIVSAVALAVLMASFTLQKLCIIGPSVGFGIQCSMAMVIAWCYAIIWDRSRK